MRLRWLALWGWSVVACAPRRAPEATPPPPCAEGARRRLFRAPDPTQTCLDRADAAFARRAEPGLLAAAIETLLQAQSIAPSDPRVLERMARAYATRAYAHPEGQVSDYLTAREQGLRCLVLAPDFAGAVANAGGLITRLALRALEPSAAGCLRWTTLAWARWLQSLGVAGAAIDLDILHAMARRVVELSGPDALAEAQALLGLVVALPPRDAKLQDAEAAFAASRSANPGDLTPRVDLAELVYGRQGQTDLWRQTLETVAQADLDEADPLLLENRRAVARARAALELGAPDPEAWYRLRP